jgi:SSS family solute:Na+ symporter
MDLQNFHNIGTSADWVIMIVYFIAIMLFGTYFGKYNRNTTDFFFGGRRFAWWLIAFSIVATGVGSHSFVKYAAKGFQHGFSSSMTYINDWFFVPFFLFGWLPIIVYTKIRSIPEYFEKRFSPSARFLATILLLAYMIGYIGIGFLTLGKAVIPMLPESFTILGMHLEGNRNFYCCYNGNLYNFWRTDCCYFYRSAPGIYSSLCRIVFIRFRSPLSWGT